MQILNKVGLHEEALEFGLQCTKDIELERLGSFHE